jgi:hypothetical protein
MTAPRLIHDSAQHLREIIVEKQFFLPGDDDAQDHGSPAREASGDQVGMIPRFIDDPRHPLARLGRDRPLAADDPRNRHFGNAGLGRDVRESDFHARPLPCL